MDAGDDIAHQMGYAWACLSISTSTDDHERASRLADAMFQHLENTPSRALAVRYLEEWSKGVDRRDREKRRARYEDPNRIERGEQAAAFVLSAPRRRW